MPANWPVHMNALQRALKTCYEKCKRSTKIPLAILRDLEKSTLNLIDLELGEEEIPVLCSFLATNAAIHELETLFLSKVAVSSVSAHKYRKSSDRDHFNALNVLDHKLFRAAINFVGVSTSLNCLMFDSIKINFELVVLLDKAIANRRSDIHWLYFRSVALGDRGLRVLTRALADSGIHVLGLERCGLTDESLPYIASIIKAQDNRMDTLYWNNTLRTSQHDRGIGIISDSSPFIPGLVAVNLEGNKIQGSTILELARSLRHNHWFLAINLANNFLPGEAIIDLLEPLRSNKALHAIILEGNPGFSPAVVPLVSFITNRVESRLGGLPTAARAIIERWTNTHDSQLTTLPAGDPPLSLLGHDLTSLPAGFPNRGSANGRTAVDASSDPNNFRWQDFSLYLDNEQLTKVDVLETAMPTPPTSSSALNGIDGSSNRDQSPSTWRGNDERPPSRISLRPRASDPPMSRSFSAYSSGDPEIVASAAERIATAGLSRNRSSSSRHSVDLVGFVQRPSSAHSNRASVSARNLSRSTLPRPASSSANRLELPRSGLAGLRKTITVAASAEPPRSPLFEPVLRRKTNAKVPATASATVAVGARSSKTKSKRPKVVKELSESVVGSTGRSASPVTTRLRSRQQQNQWSPEQYKADESVERRPEGRKKSPTSSTFSPSSSELAQQQFFEGLSQAVLSATNNLAAVSMQLRDVVSNLSDSLSMSQLHQSVNMTSFHRESDNNDTVAVAQTAAATTGSTSMLFQRDFAAARESSSSSGEGYLGAAVSSVQGSPVRASSSSPARGLTNGRTSSSLHVPASDTWAAARDSHNASLDDAELAAMIRETMREKLSSLLSPMAASPQVISHHS